MPEELEGHRFDKAIVKQRFNRVAAHYEQHAVLQQTVASHMLERLDLFRLQPALILDVGAGTGWAARLLERRYRKARVVLCDLAEQMLRTARQRTPFFFSRQSFLCADVESLPVGDTRVDMIFCNLCLQWCTDLDRVFNHFRRVLRPEGLVLFSSFGPDTLRELRLSWAEVDARVHVHCFFDMHDVGDALIRAGLVSPVMDVEHFTVTYSDVLALLHDLKQIGATNAAAGRAHGMTGKGAFHALARAYARFEQEGRLPATYEVVYGHAWAPVAGQRPQDGSTVARFPISQIKRSTNVR